MVVGYGGLRLRSNGMFFDPVFPMNTDTFVLRGIYYQRNRFTIALQDQAIIIQLISSEVNAPTLYVTDSSGKSQELTSEPIQLPLGTFFVHL